MTHGDGQSSLMSDINVTPFVDVMLVLLIIFMVTAPMMMEGINVSLPEASSKPLVLEKKPLLISINSDNKVFINDFNVTVDHLGEKLTKILDGNTSREVFLKADRNISYGMVVRVMSEIKGAGIENLGMVTIPISDKTNSEK
jgi:biopolymer transport protein TolR